MSNLLELNDSNFETEVKNHSGLCLVDFFAVWCGPCKQMTPIIEELAAEMGNKVKFAKLDVQNATQSAAEFGVMGVPTFILFKDGSAVETQVGALSKDALKTKIEAHL